MGEYSYNKTIKDIAEKYDIIFLVYFGSYQTEYYNEDSDIDIAYLAANNETSQTKMLLMEDLIKYHRKSEIDLVDLKKAEPILKYEIASNGRVLYEKKEGLFDKYSLFYIKQYYELKPIINEELKIIAQDIKEVLENAR